MIDLSPVFSLDFWFRLDPVSMSAFFETVLFFLFAIFIISGSVCRIIARQKKNDRYLVKSYRLFGQMFTIMGILGMIWFFLTYEEIYFLGARFWFLIWLLGLVVWSAMIIRYAKVIVPKLKTQGAQKAQENKYLPRRKGA